MNLLQQLGLDRNPRVTPLFELPDELNATSITSRGRGGLGPKGTPLSGQQPPPTVERVVDRIGEKVQHMMPPHARSLEFDQALREQRARLARETLPPRSQMPVRTGSISPALLTALLGGAGGGVLLALLAHQMAKQQAQDDLETP